MKADTLIWAAGVKGNFIDGMNTGVKSRNNGLQVDQYNLVKTCSNVYAVGDVAFLTSGKFPEGHPQVAQVAIQQANNLAANFIRMECEQQLKPFVYKDLGNMATVGRNLAVVDLPFVKFGGFFAWLVWMFIHLKSILGVKNKVLTFINWVWNYFTYDQSLRLIIKSKNKPKKVMI